MGKKGGYSKIVILTEPLGKRKLRRLVGLLGIEIEESQVEFRGSVYWTVGAKAAKKEAKETKRFWKKDAKARREAKDG